MANKSIEINNFNY